MCHRGVRENDKYAFGRYGVFDKYEFGEVIVDYIIRKIKQLEI